MLEIEQNELVARRGVGETDAARARALRNPAHGAVRFELRIREREKMCELSSLEAANPEVHGRPPMLPGEENDGTRGAGPPVSGTRFPAMIARQGKARYGTATDRRLSLRGREGLQGRDHQAGG